MSPVGEMQLKYDFCIYICISIQNDTRFRYIFEILQILYMETFRLDIYFYVFNCKVTTSIKNGTVNGIHL